MAGRKEALPTNIQERATIERCCRWARIEVAKWKFWPKWWGLTSVRTVKESPRQYLLAHIGASKWKLRPQRWAPHWPERSPSLLAALDMAKRWVQTEGNDTIVTENRHQLTETVHIGMDLISSQELVAQAEIRKFEWHDSNI